ncbi:lytic transglycosylase domain-containing protein [Frigidibacter sp. ROC022]|uniref:lytic transglycosylase domain-containing protein n=1 Tax=Frigidibacter sp. ROC022 TaxID=2971796 RepID=UPI00215AE508|nr:lytic transglycosylase domain-containing protein [Frigidibacter sp. ROC022]MCR8724849.1 lytic transglycosylase domain-containing protein [Frigidibacter sp. ROC022]
MRSFRAPKLFRLFFIVLMLLALGRLARADTPEQLAEAMQLMRQGDYDEALETAGPEGSVARDIIEWHRLRAGKGSFADYRDFLARRGDWPGLPYLMRFGEKTTEGADPAAVVAYYELEPPQTGKGVIAAIRAYQALGQTGDAEALAVLAWRSMSLDADQEAELLRQFPRLLAAHHVARLDMVLWQGWKAEAERAMARVPDGWKALAAARMALHDGADGVDALIAKVPAELAGDAGLAYERYRWRKRKGRDADALAMMEERSTSARALGYPERWSRDRRVIARDLMRAGKGAEAYRVASRHFLLPDDRDYPDLEWLSGYLALRFLKDPALALDHFTRFRMAVDTPISLGRAGYWEGRALEAMGAPVDAQAAYEFGAEFQTSFYGLLAAEKAGLPMDPALLGTETYPDWHKADFLDSSVMQAALLLLKAGEQDLAERFMRHLCESLDATEIGQMADMALDLDEPHIALSLAKFAAARGIVLNRPYYPLSDLAEAELPVPTELALSIARRESEFNPTVVSPAGARGLMQLMPGTAKEMAGTLGLDYELERLTTDPDYNATLGSAYLAKLVEEFGSNWMLVAAAYNAGPSRPRRWIVDYGDPRLPEVDAIDWIESIPFDETRNYVMRVTESIPVYRARLHGKVEPIALSAALEAK